jgi:Ni,Fe-hydrogenase III component G
VHPGALYPEREIAEMFGLDLCGHPNPKRLLTTEDSPPALLRRSTPIRTDEEVHDRVL